jgi:hypothetical protein
MKIIKIVVGLIIAIVVTVLFRAYPFEAGLISLLSVMAWVAFTKAE